MPDNRASTAVQGAPPAAVRHRPAPGRRSPTVATGTPLALFAASALVLAPAAALAQTADETADEAAAACTEAARLIGEQDIDGALDEAQWCVESLRQVRQQRTLTVFPDEVEGFSGGELDNQSAMGMTMMERTYTRDGDEIGVSLATGAAGSGLAALAQMGMSFGGGGGRKLRVQKRTVIDMSEEEGQVQYLVQLKSGGMLTIDSQTLSAEEVLAFVRAFPVRELDEALMP